MATQSPAIPPMPGQNVPFTLADGKINPDWHKWLETFVSIMKVIRSEIP